MQLTSQLCQLFLTLSICTSSDAYMPHSMTYTIKNKIENMESVTGIDLDAMREAYRIIAL